MRVNHQHSFQHFLVAGLLVLVLIGASSCSPTRRLNEGEYLLSRNVIVDRSASLFKLNPDLSTGDFEAYLKQKPNRRVVLVRFHLFLYNLIDPVKADSSRRRRDRRWDRINQERAFRTQKENEERLKKNKKPKQPKLKDKDRLTWREWVMDIGEPPVVYDSTLKIRTSQQLRLFLDNKGYFNNIVTDSVAFKEKTATVYYIITPNEPYKVRSLSYTIKDPLMSYYVINDTSNCLIKVGENYDADILQKERERINKALHNTGYYDFSKDYIYYKVDSSLNSNRVDIELLIRQPMIKPSDGKDTLVAVDHTRYYVNEIYIVTDYNSKTRKTYNLPDDTAGLHVIDTSGYHIVYSKMLNYKPRLLTDAMYFSPRELFRVDNVEKTYRRLSDMRAFKFINIQFTKTGGEYLDCYVYLTPILKQTYTVESELTNTGGNQGVNGSFVYQNRNAFKGAEIFEFRIKGGLEVQKLLTDDNSGSIISTEGIPFNTFEIGPEAKLTVPRFLLPIRVRLNQGSDPSTVFKVAYNYQQRPDYTLSTFVQSFGYTFNETKYKKHFIYPLEVNRVNFTGKEDFQDFINQSTDPLLVYRFSDHFTIDFRYAFVFSNQDISRKKNFSYFKFGAESSGNLLRGIFNLADQYIFDHKLPYDHETGSYLINGIKFSQYLRSDFDYRFNKIFPNNSRLVFRFAAGVGKPLHNLRELPLEKSFFAGGPNGIRAWKARTLGPGSFYKADQTNFDKIGDNQIETNLEYRFNVVRVLNAAFFVDAGNIWIRKVDTLREGAEFKYNLELLDEFAIGAGLGIRLDFSFFIVRLDAAVPLKDPALSDGDRWTFDKQPLRRTNLNFGIGYPF